jgi:GxxExxY protein
MHPKYQRSDELSRLAIGAAIEVHRLKGPGLIESIHEKCMMRELALQSIQAAQQIKVPIEYKGLVFEEPLRLDVLLEEHLILELKVVENVPLIHKAQLLSHKKLLDIPIGLIINFHSLRLVDGAHRMILPGSNQNP